MGLSFPSSLPVFLDRERHLPLNPLSTMGAYYVEHFNQPTVMLICVLTWASIGILFQLADKIFETGLEPSKNDSHAFLHHSFRPHTTGRFSWLVSTQSWLFALLLADLCLGLRFAIFPKLSKNGPVYQGH